MILKGSQRGGAMQLARHLLNAEENEHVEVFELRGFASDKSLSNALQEVVAISKGTRCQQMLFSLSLNPPIGESVPIADFESAIEQVEHKLGLQDQARAIVFHEKEGRRHAHVVWSRIDVEEMKAINLPHFKMKLKDISKDLFLEHGWTLPEGFRDKSARDPMTFSREEWQQAKRAKQDPKELKAMFQECWARSDNRASFQKALEERGFYLAKGDRRGFVAMDYRGEVYALSRWSGQKTKDLQAKLGDPKSLVSVEQTKTLISQRMTGLIQRYIGDAETALQAKENTVALKKAQIKERHCAAREGLIKQQAERWAEETKERASRFRSGFGGIWDWLTGKSRQISKENEKEAFEAIKRDDQEREKQRQEQLDERRSLQEQLESLKEKHAAEMAALREDIASYLDLGSDHDQPQDDQQDIDLSSERDQNAANQDHQRDRDFEI
ncbi:relaxase/mobilization nuclease domain-containing protein [uncultured Roseobacter sp.]|uniref:relaxase/mobilization nuclease domain-containing protein n=1 Tax=uncultured Roseobacter sp. TaxID=114847 RepID=UPI00263545CA|nr:relaxase/mobilization nuclease domain-containing protein [uncultured Roseobacter sp.]